MKRENGFAEWQTAWGTPRGLFIESEGRKLEIAFVLALALHLLPFGFLWHKQVQKAAEEVVTLQNIDLIEPETEMPAAPPAPVVEKPKSALEFLKMAIPIFKKAAEVPLDLLPKSRPEETKLIEPEKLMERKMPASPAAPEIRLDSKMQPAPKTAELAKLPEMQRQALPVTREPALKLEEVGRKAVAVPQTPAISLERAGSPERAADIASLPKTALVPRSQGAGERLVEKALPAAGHKPPAAPLGYEKRGGSSLSLDAPREAARAAPKPQVETILPKPKKEESALQISKEKVRITGPLEKRKVVQAFLPAYPDWARARNIEADVAIRFMVSGAGRVRENAVIERTSGYPALDKLALEHLKRWLFSSIGAGEPDQWGVITFRFLMD